MVARAPQFGEYVLTTDLEVAPADGRDVPERVCRVVIELPERAQPRRAARRDRATQGDHEQVWNALVTGLRDYVEKNRFRSVLLGLSGGIDSAVVAVLAADAIGADRVYCVSMPSRYSSDHSRDDAADLAERTGVHYSVQPIADLVLPFENQLQLRASPPRTCRHASAASSSWDCPTPVRAPRAHHRQQDRAGGRLLHDLRRLGRRLRPDQGCAEDPRLGARPLAQLGRDRRGEVPPIPENSITKPPSAELRPDQKDQDSLPPYDVLDAILAAYIDRKLGKADVVALGFDADIVEEVTRLVDRAEWKRRQGAIGPKISGMAFGRDRRLPITYRPRLYP